MNCCVCRAAIATILTLALPAAVAAQASNPSEAAKTTNGTAGGPTAVGGSGGLVIGGIDVDVTGRSPDDARSNGWRAAQRRAWPALWARLSGQPPSTAPDMADSALDGIVSAIEIEQEELGANRYVARLAVVFDRLRSAAYLGRYSDVVASPPLLVIPVLQDAATRSSYEPDSPWLAAWTRFRAGETSVDYVRIRPTPGDTILLNAWQAGRRYLFLWRLLIDRYQVADVLIPELILDRSYVGGPVSGVLVVRFGTSAKELGRVRVVNRAGNVDNLLDTAVREADRIYLDALRSGKLRPDPSLIPPDASIADLEDTGPLIGGGFGISGPMTMDVRVATPDDATLGAMQREISAVPGVTGVRVQSFVLGGDSSLEITSSLPPDALRYALDQRGLRLDGTELRRRAPGEAPLALPIEGGGEDQVEETTIPSGAAQ